VYGCRAREDFAFHATTRDENENVKEKNFSSGAQTILKSNINITKGRQAKVELR
jgi:hypothetical protein